jgi:serine/threonine protein kinase
MAKQYGKWRVVRDLGQGGQAITYVVLESGRDDQPENRRVLKRLKNVKRKPRFEQELEAGLALSHPNIIHVEDHDINHHPPYFVTEYCAGGTLEDSLDRIKMMSTRHRLELFRSICNGVAHAHCNRPRIIHRDLKPENIFLREPGQIPVIGDFGLCFKDDGERYTLLDEQVGSRFYMAPELADGKAEEVGPQCDIYSLGKVFYWIIANGRIFDRERHREPKYDISKDRVEPEYFLINSLLDKMIATDPLTRFSDAAVLVQEVERLIKQMDNHGHHIDIDVPQLCMFCGLGRYQVVFDQVNVPNRNVNSFEVNQTAVHIRQFGLNANVETQWLILVCDNCANVQMFRPDCSKNRTAWRRNKP